MKSSSLLLQAATSVTAAARLNCSIGALHSALPSNATILSAVTVLANGTYGQGAADIAYPTDPTNLPALCALTVNVTSSSSSSFQFGLFLPTEWNERFLAVGNGGFAGGINWLDMGAGVQYGFATISTNTGHNSTSSDGSWALYEPEKLTDWGWRAMHGSVVLAKQLTQAYYSSDIKYSYYSGCSTGGRQGLKSLEMFPEDFDGVLAGAPAWWTNHLQTWTVKAGVNNLPLNASHHIPSSLFSVIATEVLKQCDTADGVEDNIITDPRRCAFNPETLLCGRNSNSSSCLTSPQLDTLYKIYADYVDTNQTFVFPGLSPGSEESWSVVLGVSTGEPNGLGIGFVQYFLDQPDFEWQDFTYSTVQLADAVNPGNATADDFNLKPFRDRGGKLVHYHGWADGLIPTGSSLYFYNHVLRTLLEPLDDFYRFFLVPGMQHCSGTPDAVAAPWYFAGANQAADLGTGVYSVPGFEDAKHDVLLALMDWVENGTVVDEIVATKFVDDEIDKGVERQRPLCPYPKEAVYNGSGDLDSADSWECASLY